MEKFIFTIDNESQYFVSENHIIYWKNDFQKFFDVKKMFSQQGEGVVNFTPHIMLLRKRQKVSKFYILVFRQKSKNGHYCRVFQTARKFQFWIRSRTPRTR